MANPTTNFGWVMPTATDLVTDLPADFNVFGQAVDNSMADLKGGTTGQILSKATSTDMDFTWITNDVGDITAVTAGTGISGGGTSGAVTVTNSMATAITTAGDVIQGTGSGTFARLGIGTVGQVLTVNSGATALEYTTPAGGAGLVFINKTDFSASSATSVNNVFSTTYNNYRIMIVGASTTGTAAEVTLRMRVGGADTSTNYSSQRAYFNGATSGASADLFGTDETYIGDVGNSSTLGAAINLDISSPYLVTPTALTATSTRSGSGFLTLTGGNQTAATSFTGFTMNFAQTSTGSVYIYGYAKA